MDDQRQQCSEVPAHTPAITHTLSHTCLRAAGDPVCPPNSQPSTGYYDKDDIIDVVLEEDSGNGTKRVSMVLETQSAGAPLMHV